MITIMAQMDGVWWGSHTWQEKADTEIQNTLVPNVK